jgi:hypothetical protein
VELAVEYAVERIEELAMRVERRTRNDILATLWENPSAVSVMSRAR